MIRDYWISEIQKIKEFETLGGIEDGEFIKLNECLENLISDQFIQTATTNGIVRRESILKITPFTDDTLESRRFRVLSKWGNSLPYTYRSMIERLTQLCGESGFSVELNSNEYTLTIRVDLAVKRMEQDVKNLIRQMAPANLIVTVGVRYNKHKDLTKYTHRQLSAYKHVNLREEALQ